MLGVHYMSPLERERAPAVFHGNVAGNAVTRPWLYIILYGYSIFFLRFRVFFICWTNVYRLTSRPRIGESTIGCSTIVRILRAILNFDHMGMFIYQIPKCLQSTERRSWLLSMWCRYHRSLRSELTTVVLPISQGRAFHG